MYELFHQFKRNHEVLLTIFTLLPTYVRKPFFIRTFIQTTFQHFSYRINIILQYKIKRWIFNISLEHRKITLHRKFAYKSMSHIWPPLLSAYHQKMPLSFKSKEVGKDWSRTQNVGLDFLNWSLAPCGSLEIDYSTFYVG
jgi:hypothetical protein